VIQSLRWLPKKPGLRDEQVHCRGSRSDVPDLARFHERWMSPEGHVEQCSDTHDLVHSRGPTTLLVEAVWVL
jgi:hypothetical protein